MTKKVNSMNVNVNNASDLMKVSEAKKVVKSVFENEFLTPFKCLTWSNKRKKESGFVDLYKRYDITDDKGNVRDLILNDLLNVLPDGETDDKKRIFCKLSSSDKDGNAISSFVDKNDKVWYYIPIKYSTSEFFASVAARKALSKKESALNVWLADADKRKEHETKKRKKLSDKITELSVNPFYSSLNNEQIELIAREITGVRLPL